MTWVHSAPRATASVCLCFTERATLASEAKRTGLEIPRGPTDMPPELGASGPSHTDTRCSTVSSQRGHSLTS